MKQFFLSAMVILFSISLVNGQEYKKLLKQANKTLGKYYLDPVANKSLLPEAIATIDKIFSTDEAAKADPEAWTSKGQIYNEIAKTEINKKIISDQMKEKYEIATPDAAINALEAFEKAMTLAVKKSQTKDALSGIKDNEEFLNNVGITQFQAGDYNGAFKNFSASIRSSDLLKANKENTRLAVDSVKTDQLFYTGVCAYYGDNKQETAKYFEPLYKANIKQPLVYEALFTLTSEKDIDKAMQYLEAGRKVNPDDSSLLFAEINYYLKVGKLDVLTDKLKAAIAKEPNNISVYVTLGNVYDQINQKERTAGNTAAADQNFNLALDYFSQALAKDPKNFDAKYSQGALFYNKAASIVTKLNEFGNDYSSAGTKKYNAFKADMDALFLQAQPYFLEAEALDPKDVNTMTALKEIYARQGKLDKSAEYKAKIEALGGN